MTILTNLVSRYVNHLKSGRTDLTILRSLVQQRERRASFKPCCGQRHCSPSSSLSDVAGSSVGQESCAALQGDEQHDTRNGL